MEPLDISRRTDSGALAGDFLGLSLIFNWLNFAKLTCYVLVFLPTKTYLCYFLAKENDSKKHLQNSKFMVHEMKYDVEGARKKLPFTSTASRLACLRVNFISLNKW